MLTVGTKWVQKKQKQLKRLQGQEKLKRRSYKGNRKPLEKITVNCSNSIRKGKKEIKEVFLRELMCIRSHKLAFVRTLFRFSIQLPIKFIDRDQVVLDDSVLQLELMNFVKKTV